MFGQLPAWLKETPSPILVMATPTTFRGFRPESMRAGGLDTMFFADIPKEKSNMKNSLKLNSCASFLRYFVVQTLFLRCFRLIFVPDNKLDHTLSGYT